jgi:ADP-sugar diphosphatase
MEQLEESLKYRQWHESLKANGASLTQLDELYTHHKPNGEVLFSLVNATAYAETGTPLLPVFLIRGGFVMVVIELVLEKTGERRLLLVRQYRLSSGGIFYSHPAGMVDSETDPYAVVIKEVWEETGIRIERSQIAPLSQTPYFTSDGILDETGLFFWVSLPVTQHDIETMQGRKTGAPGEPEFITVHIATIPETLQLVRNMASQLCTYLYLHKTGQPVPVVS